MSGGAVAELSQPEYDVVMARSAGMQARDGTLLATDVWRPARDGEALPGPFPAILTRTPYGRIAGTSDLAVGNGEFFASRGYIYASQDVRGRFGSGGDFVLLADEGPDGYDAVEWVAALPYCDGNVGTQGTSYLAWVQNALAIERPPHLKAMWINQGSSNGNTSSLRHNGALELRWLTWAVTHGAVSPEALRDPALQQELMANGREMYEWLQRLPWGPGNSPLEGLPGYERWAEQLYTHGDGESEDGYWLQRGLNFEPYRDESADVPTVYSGGWYDSYTRATTDNYVALSGRLADQRLLMGPWTHGDLPLDRTYSGDVDLGPEASIAGNLAESRRHLLLRWFDHWLKGVDNGVAGDAAVKIFVMGGADGGRTDEGRLRHGGHWRDEAAWPLGRAVATDFYLHPGGQLIAGDAAGEEGEASSFVFDQEYPLPTVSANTSSLNEMVEGPERVIPPSPLTMMRLMVVQGGSDQTTREGVRGAEPPFGPLADRADTLLFETAPLESAIEVTGPVEVTLHASSDAADTDLFAMLIDAYPPSEQWPDGYRLNVADGIMRLRYREGMAKPVLLEPGEVYEVRFPLYPTSNLFAAGHRLQLLISSSSFPRFDVNPNTGEPIGRHTRTQVAHNSIHHSAAYPSKITLPVIPA
jgi:putative CocE/NonD family hydrolase